MVSVSIAAPAPIGVAEREGRLTRLREGMAATGVGAVLLGSTSSLRYFTGIDWYPSERLLGAVVHASGKLDYISPRFELEKIEQLISLPGDILTFGDGSDVTHVGMYVGEGRFIHSASRGVRVSRLAEDDADGRWWLRRWLGVRRIVE